jgi:Filamentation induced by cAMP protein Fic-like, C-terminal domain
MEMRNPTSILIKNKILLMVTLPCHSKVQGTMIGTMTGIKLLALIDYMVQDRKKEEILSFLGLTNKTGNFNRYIKTLIELGWLEWPIPEKPKSKRQKYKLTLKGRKLLKG